MVKTIRIYKVLAKELNLLEAQDHYSFSYQASFGGDLQTTLHFIGIVNGSPIQILMDVAVHIILYKQWKPITCTWWLNPFLFFLW